VKKPSKRIRVCSSGISRGQKIRGLKESVGELKDLCAEATSILLGLQFDPLADDARGLCSRFRILQAYFSIRHREAQELALAVLGSIGAIRGSA
jgi:hypothetical protein